MTRQTGWMGGEEPEAEVPAMPLTELLMSRRHGQQQPGAVLEQSLARAAATEAREAREAAAAAPDPDERAANLIAGGYSPGLLSQLAQRLGDTLAELEGERHKLERAARRAEFAGREHAAGRVDVFRMLAMLNDGDDGDEGRVRMLERRAESLRGQIAETQNMISPPQQRELNGVESASRHAHDVFVEVTRQRMAEARAAAPEPRPFDSVSRGRSTEHTGPDCQVCAEARRRDAAWDRAAYAAGSGEIAR